MAFYVPSDLFLLALGAVTEITHLAFGLLHHFDDSPPSSYKNLILQALLTLLAACTTRASQTNQMLHLTITGRG